VPSNAFPKDALQRRAESDIQKDDSQLLKARNTEGDLEVITYDTPEIVTMVEPDTAIMPTSIEDTDGPS
jgi:hypothetical protein